MIRVSMVMEDSRKSSKDQRMTEAEIASVEFRAALTDVYYRLAIRSPGDFPTGQLASAGIAIRIDPLGSAVGKILEHP